MSELGGVTSFCNAMTPCFTGAELLYCARSERGFHNTVCDMDNQICLYGSVWEYTGVSAVHNNAVKVRYPAYYQSRTRQQLNYL